MPTQPPSLTQGSLLRALLAAQDASEEAVDYPDIERWAAALVKLAAELGDPVLLPVSGLAERLTGAAVASARGSLRVRSLSNALDGECVLLVEVVAVGALQLHHAAEHARRLGATKVIGCAAGLHSHVGVGALDGYFDLTPEHASHRVATAA